MIMRRAVTPSDQLDFWPELKSPSMVTLSALCHGPASGARFSVPAGRPMSRRAPPPGNTGNKPAGTCAEGEAA